MAAMGPTIGKGLVILLTADAAGGCAARVISIVAIYSAEGVLNEALNERIGKALMSGPARWQAVTRLRRDTHEPSPQCWLHAPTWCLTGESAV